MVTLNFFFIASLICHLFFFFILQKKKFIFFNENKKNLKRWGDSYKSHYGGLAFFVSFFLLFFIVILFFPKNDESTLLNYSFFIIFLVSIYGILDEKFIFNAKLKLILQLFFSFILVKSGFEIKLFFNPELNFIFNLVWYLFLFNAFNMVDNIDLGYFSAVFPSFIFFVISIYLYDFYPYIEILAVFYFAGILVFFIFNFYPSKIFLGEIGSSQLTVVIIILSYFLIWKEKEFINYQTSLYDFLKNNLFFIYIFTDFIITISKRIYLKKAIYLGDTNHISHIFTKFISVNYFSLYVITHGILSVGVYYLFENYFNIANWKNILILLNYYFFVLVINLIIYLLLSKKNV